MVLKAMFNGDLAPVFLALRSSQPFLSYQWDILLLEAVFIAILIRSSELNVLSNSFNRQTAIAGTWLLRLVLFKLVWSSGVVKITPVLINLAELNSTRLSLLDSTNSPSRRLVYLSTRWRLSPNRCVAEPLY